MELSFEKILNYCLEFRVVKQTYGYQTSLQTKKQSYFARNVGVRLGRDVNWVRGSHDGFHAFGALHFMLSVELCPLHF